MCYPDSVLFHVRLRGLTKQQAEILADTPGFHCRLQDEGTTLVSIRFAHDVPSHPDPDALERRLRLALGELVPGADIRDVSYGFRYARDASSPATDALHCLRRAIGKLPAVDSLEREELAEVLTIFAREFTHLDDLLCNGGTVPPEWIRRHPEGDRGAAQQIADTLRPVVMAS